MANNTITATPHCKGIIEYQLILPQIAAHHLLLNKDVVEQLPFLANQPIQNVATVLRETAVAETTSSSPSCPKSVLERESRDRVDA